MEAPDPQVEIEATCEMHHGSGRLVIRREGDRIVLDARADLMDRLDELAEHSGGVYRAQCGHVLLAVTPLRVVPAGWVCDGCRAGYSDPGSLVAGVAG